MALLEVNDLKKWYGKRQVVNGVSFEVNQGEVVGLLGPNGAGKTTSFRMTIGLIDADGGTVFFDGKNVTKLPMYQRARSGMGYLAQDSSVFKQLSVEDNLMAILETRPLNRKQRRERQDELLNQFGLTHIRRTKANRVSGGERRRLEIARSLITEPKLILLDEPFAGIDPKTVAEIQDSIRGLVEQHNLGILLTDHQFRETLEVTDRCYLIREGQVFAYGNRTQIIDNPDVKRYYIGERFDVGSLRDDPKHKHSLPGDTNKPKELVIDIADVDDQPAPGTASPPAPTPVAVIAARPAPVPPPIVNPTPVADIAAVQPAPVPPPIVNPVPAADIAAVQPAPVPPPTPVTSPTAVPHPHYFGSTDVSAASFFTDATENSGRFHAPHPTDERGPHGVREGRPSDDASHGPDGPMIHPRGPSA